jgi:hypothetical protein
LLIDRRFFFCLVPDSVPIPFGSDCFGAVTGLAWRIMRHTNADLAAIISGPFFANLMAFIEIWIKSAQQQTDMLAFPLSG